MKKDFRVKYKFVEEFNLIVEKHIGAVDLSILIKSMEILSSKREFSVHANYLIDLRATQFNMDIDRVKQFVKFVEEKFPEALKNRIALIADESDQVAMATLFKMLQSENSQNIHVFSTLEYALLWLNIEAKEDQMEKMIEDSTILIS